MKQLPDKYIYSELSHGTMREEDLIPTFMDFLQDVKVQCEIIAEVELIQEDVDKLELEEKDGYGTYYAKPEDASWLLNEDIWGLLNDIAPRFTYFGSNEGDGAAYGFWTSEEGLEEHIFVELDSISQHTRDEFSDVKQELEILVDLLANHGY